MRKYTLADLPPLPRGAGNRRQLAAYARSTGLTSASERTYERLPLPYKLINGEARYDWRMFATWLLNHINCQPLRHCNKRRATVQPAPAPAPAPAKKVSEFGQ